MAQDPRIFYGQIISPTSLTSYDAFSRCLLAVGSGGNISWLEKDVEEGEVDSKLKQHGIRRGEIVRLGQGEFLMPGLIDTHTHGPQFPNMGSGQQYQLLDWLANVTFPREAKFKDTDYAHKEYSRVVRTTIDCGTTTCCYYGTIHLEGTKVLADVVADAGQRAFIGKCNMNRESPDYYCEPSVEKSVADTKDFISYTRTPKFKSNSSFTEPLVQPILTPRFAISCTTELLKGLGDLAKGDPTLRIQTHVSENKNEIAYVRELFREAPSYIAVYDTNGLLTERTILAHAVHLEDSEIELISQRNAGISHCPTSNYNLTSGVAPIGKYLDRSIKVGLGTDVSGGYSPSILTVIQAASIAAKDVALSSTETPQPGKFANKPLPVATLLYLATLGGAQVCCLEKHIGSLEPNKAFDALRVKITPNMGNPGVWYESEMGLDEMVERFLFGGDDRNITEVYVQGRLIGGRNFVALPN